MKTTEIIEIYNILNTKLHEASAWDAIAMNEWHERRKELEPTKSIFDEELYKEFKDARERMHNVSAALDAFMNHDWS